MPTCPRCRRFFGPETFARHWEECLRKQIEPRVEEIRKENDYNPTPRDMRAQLEFLESHRKRGTLPPYLLKKEDFAEEYWNLLACLFDYELQHPTE